MSDLANLVVATIRDKVVTDQQTEIHQLRETLQETTTKNQQLQHQLIEANPLRSVSLTGPNGAPVYAINPMLRIDQSDDQQPMNLFDTTRDDAEMGLTDFLQTQLRVNNAPVYNVSDLQLSIIKYAYCSSTLIQFAVLQCSSPTNVLLHAYIPMDDSDEYCQLVNVTMDSLNCHENGGGVCDARSHTMTYPQLTQGFMREKEVKLFFGEGEMLAWPSLFRAE